MLSDQPWPKRHSVRWGPSFTSPKGGRAPQFSAHVYCGQTAGWIKMPLGMKVSLGPCHIVLDGKPAPALSERGTTAPLFSAHVYCGHGHCGTVAHLSYCWGVVMVGEWWVWTACCQTVNGSALHQAALYGRLDVVKLLLERGETVMYILFVHLWFICFSAKWLSGTLNVQLSKRVVGLEGTDWTTKGAPGNNFSAVGTLFYFNVCH